MRKNRQAGSRAVLSRALAAAVGGYLLASVLPVPLVALWPIARVDAVLAAMAASFAVYTAAVMWAFAARTAAWAWAGLAVATMLSVLGAWAVL